MRERHRFAARCGALVAIVTFGLGGPAAASPLEDALRVRDREGPHKAVPLLEDLWRKDPRSLEAGYNLGLCLIESGNPDSAARVLEAVVGRPGIRPALRQDALYNLGLAHALVAQRLQPLRPAKAREVYGQAIRAFRDAMGGQRNRALEEDAGYNIEAIWRLLAQLEQQMQQASSGVDSLAERLQDLLHAQQDLRTRTNEGARPEDLDEEQRGLSQRTSDLAEAMERQGMERPGEALTQAARAQERASEELSRGHAQEAVSHQDEALGEMREALAALLGEEGPQARPDSAQGLKAAEELARIDRQAQEQRRKREEQLRRDPRYRPQPTPGRIVVEKDW